MKDELVTTLLSELEEIIQDGVNVLGYLEL